MWPWAGRCEWRTALGFGLGTLVLGGTLFLVSPNGLGAWAGSIQEYLLGWIQPSGMQAGTVLIALLAYQPLALIFGLAAAVRGWLFGSRRAMILSLWALVTLLLVLFYPAREASGLAWMILPLSALAALELAHHLDLHLEERAEVAGAIALVAFMLVAAWMSLTSIAQNPLDPANTVMLPITLFGKLSIALPPRPITLLLVLLFILVVSLLLVAMGWSVRMARLGAVWGAALALGFYSFAGAWSAAGLRTPPTVEMWTAGPDPDQADLLLMTADQLSDWTQGNNEALPVTIAGLDSPALQWLLRGHKIELVESLDPSSAPALILTRQQDELGLAVPYRGQDFVWTRQPLWESAAGSDWLRWIVFRQMPQTAETVILWARNDLFLDSGATAP